MSETTTKRVRDPITVASAAMGRAVRDRVACEVRVTNCAGALERAKIALEEAREIETSARKDFDEASGKRTRDE